MGEGVLGPFRAGAWPRVAPLSLPEPYGLGRWKPEHLAALAGLAGLSQAPGRCCPCLLGTNLLFFSGYLLDEVLVL